MNSSQYRTPMATGWPGPHPRGHGDDREATDDRCCASGNLSQRGGRIEIVSQGVAWKQKEQE